MADAAYFSRLTKLLFYLRFSYWSYLAWVRAIIPPRSIWFNAADDLRVDGESS